MSLKSRLKERIHFWWHFESEPRKERLQIWFDEFYQKYIEHAYIKVINELKWWWYLYILSTLNSIKSLLESSNKDSFVYYNSKITLLYPFKVEIGSVVVSKFGIGQIRRIEFTKAFVHMVTANSRSRGYCKYLEIRDLSQMVIYHEPSKQYIPVSPKDYVYIIDENQPIEYRITIRGLATISNKFKAELEPIKMFNSVREGHSLYKNLRKKGYVIRKA